MAIVFVLLVLSFTYALSVRGAVGPGMSLRWLAEAMWRDHTFEVNRFDKMGLLDDHSQSGDDKYIHWPPGPAFLGLPFFAAGQIAAGEPEQSLEGIICGGPSRTLALFFCVCAALATVLLFAVGWELSRSRRISGAVALVFAFGFTTWPYAAIYSRHVPAATLVIAAVYCGLRARRDIDDFLPLFGLAFSAGLLPLFDYSSLIVAPALLLLGWPAWTAAAKHPTRLFWTLALFAIGPAILGVYNWICFGAPWTTSYDMSVQHEWSRTFSGTFNGSPLSGVRFLLFHKGLIPESLVLRTGFPDHFLDYYRRQHFVGLFRHAPLLWLAIPGFVLALTQKSWRTIFACLLLATLPTLFLMGAHRTLFGGAGFDTRYIFHITPVLFAVVAFFLGAVLGRIPRREGLWATVFGVMILLAGVQPFLQNIQQIVTTTVGMEKTCPNILPQRTIFHALFPNLSHVGPTILLLAVFWAVIFLCWEGTARRWGRRNVQKAQRIRRD